MDDTTRLLLDLATATRRALTPAGDDLDPDAAATAWDLATRALDHAGAGEGPGEPAPHAAAILAALGMTDAEVVALGLALDGLPEAGTPPQVAPPLAAFMGGVLRSLRAYLHDLAGGAP